MTEAFLVFALCLFAYGLASKWLGNSFVSAPMAFMFVGLGAGPAGLGLFHLDVESEVLEVFGEFTLGFILFADAATTNDRRLAKDYAIPRRLLLISLPLMIALGAAIAILIFPNLHWTEAALIAAILAPTDAALGFAVVSSPLVPERIRQAILVESGLNDGLALPVVLFFAALAYGSVPGIDAAGEEVRDTAFWLSFTGQQIALGAAAGAILGLGLGKFVQLADNQGAMTHTYRALLCIGIAIIILIVAEAVGGNGFVATFVGGLAFGSVRQKSAQSLTSFIEEEGQLFSLIIFFIFGAALLPNAMSHFTTWCVFYALLSLTIIRTLPTMLSLTGTGLSLPGKGFISWFGPRGLASILFLLIAVERDEMGALTEIEAVVYVTVFLSIILHGISAPTLSRWYGNSIPAKTDAG